MGQPHSREIRKFEWSAYAFTVAINHEDQSSEASNFMDPEIETGMKYFAPSRQGLEKLLQMQKRREDFLQYQYTSEDMIQAFYEILGILNPPWCDECVLDRWTQEVYYPKVEGMSDDDRYGCALALSLYTGPSIGDSGRSAVLQEEFDGWNNNYLGLKRFLDSAFVSTEIPPQDKPYAVLTSFLFKALNNLPTYKGKCVKGLYLSPEEDAFHTVGKILAMTSFNSSSRGDNPPDCFAKENARFVISSSTGVFIAPSSNHPEENEVLFAPGCTFMVVKKETKDGIIYIYLREVELGITEKTLLCFDERVDEENWEYKEAFDKFRSQEHIHGTRIIRKSSEAQVSAFLESPFGQEILKVITILERLPKNQVVNVATLMEFFKNPNFNVEPPFAQWLVQTKDEARESLYRREEAESMDFNLQKKQAVRSSYMQGDFASNDPLLSTSMNHETFNTIDQINLDNFASPISMDWNLNSGFQPDNLMSGGLKPTVFAIEESSIH